MKDPFAFPRVTQLGERAPGMELQDWFAGMALQGLLSGILVNQDRHLSLEQMASIACTAYDEAYFMIQYRNKEQNND